MYVEISKKGPLSIVLVRLNGTQEKLSLNELLLCGMVIKTFRRRNFCMKKRMQLFSVRSCGVYDAPHTELE